MRLNNGFRLLLIVLLTFLSHAAWACRCDPLPVSGYFQRAETVMEVEIQSAIPGDSAMHGAHYRARYRMLKQYKGQPGQFHYIKTALSGAACGIPLEPGSRLWVFGYRREEDPRGLWIDNCSGSQPVGQAVGMTPAAEVREALEALGVPQR